MPARSLLTSARGRAEAAGVPFTITERDVRAAWPADGRCPVFGTTLSIGKGSRRDHSPSLDRLNNAWGYEPGNIAVISWRANKLKSDASAEELGRLAAWMQSHGLS